MATASAEPTRAVARSTVRRISMIYLRLRSCLSLSSIESRATILLLGDPCTRNRVSWPGGASARGAVHAARASAVPPSCGPACEPASEPGARPPAELRVQPEHLERLLQGARRLGNGVGAEEPAHLAGVARLA